MTCSSSDINLLDVCAGSQLGIFLALSFIPLFKYADKYGPMLRCPLVLIFTTLWGKFSRRQLLIYFQPLLPPYTPPTKKQKQNKTKTKKKKKKTGLDNSCKLSPESFSYFYQKTGFDISCIKSPQETISMYRQLLLSQFQGTISLVWDNSSLRDNELKCKEYIVN